MLWVRPARGDCPADDAPAPALTRWWLAPLAALPLRVRISGKKRPGSHAVVKAKLNVSDRYPAARPGRCQANPLQAEGA